MCIVTTLTKHEDGVTEVINTPNKLLLQQKGTCLSCVASRAARRPEAMAARKKLSLVQERHRAGIMRPAAQRRSEGTVCRLVPQQKKKVFESPP